ncbi:MAG: DUF547 domain-containing protein [Planctomycetales bacterium]|nr:DUF547 domain-containing protein [Planctomycetales bacterium]
MQTKNITTVTVLFSVIALTFGSHSLAADVLVGTNVPAARQTPLDQIDHSVWDGLLKKYVDDKGMVKYKAWKTNTGDTQALDQYLAQLSHSNGKGTKEQQLAFWINAYNAVTVKGILQE